ncbi:lamin tail domain-containing protein [Lacipirellula limnantheis]|uniref:lamin tail domain-containing protein n=1 Tax=Lacipirellula limnantheis TaxID=2528024 RepID=UPI00143DB673|nr:lamin tail domain-containing protein [Lacipirellula limnantheis]
MTVLAAGIHESGHAQLVVTEAMVNPKSADDAVWEWIEVRNEGQTPVDLNGALFAKLGEVENTKADVSTVTAANTIIPAGGMAVLYDGDGSAFNDQLFRQAWSLGAGVPLIAVDGFPGLANSGTGRNFGLWLDAASYAQSLADDGQGTQRVSSFAGAACNLDYSVGFPSVSVNGASIAWNGLGAYGDGANWAVTAAGSGVITSVPVIAPGTPVNNPLDIGNPGRVAPGSATPGLLISEIMYDPASPDGTWEWVELYNNTGATINFGATPYVFHDTTTSDGGDLTAANIASGVLGQGKTAVLFKSGLNIDQMKSAWDPGNALGTLFIPVDDFPSLNNSGDTIAVWDSLADYLIDAASTTPSRTTTQAITSLTYDDSAPWPTTTSRQSIHLVNLASPASNGASWARSVLDDLAGSANAAQVFDSVAIHPGGDLGTPGTFGAAETTIDADFNNDGIVNGADLLIWQRGFGVGVSRAAGDADGDGAVNAADLAWWKSTFGTPFGAAVAIPEPTAIVIGGTLFPVLAKRRRGAN